MSYFFNNGIIFKKLMFDNKLKYIFLSKSFLLFIIAFLYSSQVILSQGSMDGVLMNDTCRDMVLVGEPEYFIGDDLFSLINGGADLYHEYGFREVVTAKYGFTAGDTVKAEVYDMGSPEGAWGIYSMTETSKARPFSAGVAGRQGEGFVQFIKGSYMVYIYHQGADAFDLQYLSGCLSAGMAGSYPQPSLMQVLESLEGEKDKIVYFKGNLGLSSVYSFHYKDVFGYAEGAAAAFPTYMVILLAYDDENACIEGFNQARDFFMNSSKYHGQMSHRGSFHMKDRKERQIDCLYEGSFLMIFIREGEMDFNPDREAILEAIRTIPNTN